MTRPWALLVTLASTAACATEGKMAWTFEPGPTSRWRATPTKEIEAVSLADDSVVTIEPATPDVAIADNKGAMGGPIDESDEPVLGTAPEFWLTLPEAPRIMMLQWPLPATGVTSAFGDRADPLEGDARFHYGIDLEAQYGQVVCAAAAGRVSTVGWNHGHGRQ
ncbi:MAG: M23 family metallopeptidase, partial [Myxococcota bacterium]